MNTNKKTFHPDFFRNNEIPRNLVDLFPYYYIQTDLGSMFKLYNSVEPKD